MSKLRSLSALHDKFEGYLVIKHEIKSNVGFKMCSLFTLMIHANITGVEADVVLVFEAFILSHAEQHSIFHF